MAANLLIHIPHASLHLPTDFWRDSLAELNDEEWEEYLAATETVDGFVMLRDYLIDV